MRCKQREDRRNEDEKCHIEDSDAIGIGRGHPLLDVSRRGLADHLARHDGRDGLDVDVAVVPAWHTGTDVPRMALAADARAGIGCGVLKRYDNVSFPKALGTVVTERAIDSLLVMGITAIVLLLEMSTFGMFFRKTGTNLHSILHGFSWAGYLVVAICAVAILILLHFLLRKLSIYDKVRATLRGIWQGVISLKDVRNIPLFVFFTLAIWVSYFLHYYLTFFCFDFTADLGLGCALVTFIVGSIAVIVPTPNGAGPWHFAVKTMLILYGVADEKALYFVLIVHTVQTLLVVALGIYAWLALNFTKSNGKSSRQA